MTSNINTPKTTSTSESDCQLQGIALIADEDTVVGFLLAGTGEKKGENTNFLVTTKGWFHTNFILMHCMPTVLHKDTQLQVIEEFYRKIVDRHDIALLLISQMVINNHSNNIMF
jgi:vacuolar-type H+-ATPase subunit F/Vma7